MESQIKTGLSVTFPEPLDFAKMDKAKGRYNLANEGEVTAFENGWFAAFMALSKVARLSDSELTKMNNDLGSTMDIEP